MSSSLTRLLVLATALFLPVLAQAVAFTNDYYTGITATTPFVLTWFGDNTPVEISLMNGDPGNLQFVSTVVNGITGTNYTWTPPPITTPGVYALSISQSGAVNYSPQFIIYTAPPITTSQTTITSFTATSTNIVASNTMMLVAVASSLIPSNSTVLPLVTSVPPYPTVNQNSTYTGSTGTVASTSISSYPSVTGAGNSSATGSPTFAGAAGTMRAEIGMAVMIMVGPLAWALLMA